MNKYLVLVALFAIVQLVAAEKTDLKHDLEKVDQELGLMGKLMQTNKDEQDVDLNKLLNALEQEEDKSINMHRVKRQSSSAYPSSLSYYSGSYPSYYSGYSGSGYSASGYSGSGYSGYSGYGSGYGSYSSKKRRLNKNKNKNKKNKNKNKRRLNRRRRV